MPQSDQTQPNTSMPSNGSPRYLIGVTHEAVRIPDPYEGAARASVEPEGHRCGRCGRRWDDGCLCWFYPGGSL